MRDNIKTFHVNVLKFYSVREDPLVASAMLETVCVAVSDDLDNPDHLLELGTCDKKKTKGHLVESLTKEQSSDVLDIVEKYEDIVADLPGTTNILNITLGC